MKQSDRKRKMKVFANRCAAIFYSFIRSFYSLLSSLLLLFFPSNILFLDCDLHLSALLQLILHLASKVTLFLPPIPHPPPSQNEMNERIK